MLIMLIKTLSSFVLTLLIVTASISSKVKEESESVDVRHPNKPLFYKLKSKDKEFFLLGTDHVYPYEKLPAILKKNFQTFDILVSECEDMPWDCKMKILEIKYPRTEKDTVSLNNLCDYIKNTAHMSTDSKGHSYRLSEHKFKSFIERTSLNFGVSLTIFERELHRLSFEKGMDESIKALFLKSKKQVRGLISMDRQLEVLRDAATLSFTPENAVDLIDEFLFKRDGGEAPRLSSLEECRKDFDKAVKEGSSLATRDEEFCQNTDKIISQYLKEKILIMVGYNHLPYMLDFFKEKKFCIIQQ